VVIPRPRPDRERLAAAVEPLRSAKKPLIISGGGTRYSLAEGTVAQFALDRGIPISETIAGKGAVTHEHPAHVGPVGILGSTSANALAAEADVVLAIGTRLMDFTTGSWTVFDHDARIIGINAARWDATKHRSLAVVGDARETVAELDAALGDWKAPASWTSNARELMAEWDELLDRHQKPTNAPVPTYAQVIATVQAAARPTDPIITAAGGLPGELVKGWRVKAPNTFDCEFGFSCMGYEIAAGWGYAMARPDTTPIVMVGDGTYLMMNSDVYSSVLSGHKFILIICDNGGYGVINRLQNAKGTPGFNNLIRDCKVVRPFPVDFVRHAESMGALARRCESLADLDEAMRWAQENDRTSVITIDTDAFAWVPGDADWDVGVPEVSERAAVREARAKQVEIRSKQRVGV